MGKVWLVGCLATVMACSSGGSQSVDAALDGAPNDAPDGPDVVVCDNDWPAPATGSCDVSGGAGNGVLLRGTVLGPDQTWRHGSVLVEGDKIVCAGCDCDEQAADARVVTCADAVISPGLINAHDHLNFTEGHPIDFGGERFDHRHDWRAFAATPANPHGTSQTSNGMRWGELRMMFGGVTSYVGRTRANGLLRNLDSLESADESRGFQTAVFDTFSLGDGNRQFRDDCGWDYRRDEREVAEMSAYLPHVAEGIDDYAAEEFDCQSTSFAGGQDYVESNVSHIHAIGLTAVDLYHMARDNARIIWSPRTNISLYGMTARVSVFDRFGGDIGLGTDWTFSGSANMLRELQCVDSYNREYLAGHFDDRAIWRMATMGGAIATGNAARIGSIEAGKQADIAIFAGGSSHRAVIEADNDDVIMVMRDGRVLFGEADTLSELGESCDPVDVCGQARSVCASREFSGASYASIAADVGSGTSAYPAIFCGTPDSEPSCLPTRPGEYDGLRTDSDRDGDGLANESDNCPDVFNPIRPIDGGSQADVDGDGIGDECDDTILPEDIDGDSIPNADDNCPFVTNTDQDDEDNDAKGDTCDFCPAVANAMSVCPEGSNSVLISDIQMGAVAVNSVVTISNVVVTSTWGAGFQVQDPTAINPEYSGVGIFQDATPTVDIGDAVTITGRVAEYHGDTQLEDVSVSVLGTSTPLAPVAITIAEAASEAFEGVLVRITDATSFVSPYDCGVDGACFDDNLWELAGPGAAVVVFDRSYQGADWSQHVGQMEVAGVMMYRWNRRRIMPRTAADF